MINKYRAIFQVTWSDQFVYRLNFVMWRVRMVVQMLAIYFLWQAVMSNNPNAFGYSKEELLTYILGIAVIRAIVFSGKSTSLQADISSGDLNNFLIKPVNITSYWISRDMADKLLNSLFSLIEVGLIMALLRPPLVWPNSFLIASAVISMVTMAALLYFFFSQLISLSVFWMPEGNGWPQRFLIFVLMEFLAGGLFPLDILPKAMYAIVSNLPTAYMLHVPMQVYLGRINLSQNPEIFIIMLAWIIVFFIATRWLLRLGLKRYEAYGR